MYKLLLPNTDHLQQFEDYVDCDIADIQTCVHYLVDMSRGNRDRMVVGFTTTYEINAYQH